MAKPEKSTAAISGKTRGRPFPTGTSGNPIGRPPLTDAQKKAREMRAQCQPQLVKELLAIATDKDADTKDRVACLKALLEDLPAQVEVNDVTDRPEEKLSKLELIAMGLGELKRLTQEKR